MTTPVRMSRILIADDHRLFADGLAALLGDQGYQTEIVTELDRIEPVLATAPPDLLILDLAFADRSAMPLLRDLRARRPTLPILVISASEEGVLVERVRETGAAYIAKSRAASDVVGLVPRLLDGSYVPPRPIRRRSSSRTSALIGGAKLTRAHIDVLKLIRLGDSNAEIAEKVGRTLKTVEGHVGELFARVGVHNRAHLIRWANDHARELHIPLDGT